MAKICRRNGLYIIRSPLPKEVFDEEIGGWCLPVVEIKHANPSGSTISIRVELANDMRLAFLFKAVCELEDIRKVS